MQLSQAGEAITELRVVIRDLIASELGSINAALAAHGEHFTLLSAERKASEERTKEAIVTMSDRLIGRIESACEEAQEAAAPMCDKLSAKYEFARSQAQHAANEIKLLIGFNYEQRKREQAEARVAELERRLQPSS